jgi:hypothetical protein
VNELPGDMITENSDEVERYYTVYPNPASNFIVIEKSGDEKVRGEIISSMGILLYQFDVTTPNEKIALDMFPSGLYFVRLRGKQADEIQKVIIR